MTIELDIRNGRESWPLASALRDLAWPPESAAIPPRDVADFRVLLEDETGLVCHLAMIRRQATWDGRKLNLGGLGGLMTRPDARRRGYAGAALGAAIQTMRAERVADVALIFAPDHLIAYLAARGWKDFTGDIVAQGGIGPLQPMVFDLRRAPRTGTLDLCGGAW